MDDEDVEHGLEVADTRDPISKHSQPVVSIVAGSSSSSERKPVVPAKRRDGDAVAVKTKKQK